MLKYKCIHCGEELIESSENYTCKSCNHVYENKNGIKIFNKKTNYYGDLPEKEMKELLNQMDNTDWKKLVYDRFAESNPFLYYIITDSNRADWQYLIPLNEDSLVLDIGVGWGTISFPISQRAKVVALDGTYDRLNFVKKRAVQEGNNNIIEFINANVLELPFQEKQFDLIILNGVLEWVGASVDDGDPYELQIKALENIFSLLKDGGSLYIGIENMYGYKYLLGAADDHTMLPDICYLDREKANEYSRKKLGRDYRTYTYDQRTHKEMLTTVGFKEIDFYYPYPDYKTMQCVMDLDSNVIKYFNENIMKKESVESFNGRVQALENISCKLSNIGEYVPSYSIIARKGDVIDK